MNWIRALFINLNLKIFQNLSNWKSTVVKQNQIVKETIFDRNTGSMYIVITTSIYLSGFSSNHMVLDNFCLSMEKNSIMFCKYVAMFSKFLILCQVYQKVLELDLDYALEKKVEQDLWNVGFKQQIEALQAISKDRKVQYH